MDPFSERDIIESLKSMATSLRNIDRKLDDITNAIRESNVELFGEETEEDSTEGLNDPTIKFEVAEDDSVGEGKFEEDSEEGEGEQSEEIREKEGF